MPAFKRTCIVAFLLTLQPLIFSVVAQSLSAARTPQGVEIREGSRQILFYQIEPKSQNGQYARSHYIHPVYTLRGNVLTEDFPDDHPHHHGIFWSWHEILLNGKKIADGWTSENVRWEVAKSKVRKKKGCVILHNEVLWKSIVSDSEETIVKEQFVMTVYPAETRYRVFDFDILLVALKDRVQIGGSDNEKGYGGFSWRITLPDDIRFLGAGGEITPQVNAVNAGGWLSAVGSFDGKGEPESGIAVFSHPSNPGHPNPWILRKERSMQNAAFPGRTPVLIPKEGLRLKYRVLLHNESVRPTDITRLYQAYIAR